MHSVNFHFLPSVVSMAMKFHERLYPFDSTPAKYYWTEYLRKYRSFPLDAVQLKDGLEFGRLLDLPFELACNVQHVGDLLATDTFVRPFKELG